MGGGKVRNVPSGRRSASQSSFRATAIPALLHQRDFLRQSIAKTAKRNPQIIFAHHADFGFACRHLKRRLGVPLVLAVAPMEENNRGLRLPGWLSRLKQNMERKTLQSADAIFVSSSKQKEHLIATYGISAVGVHVIAGQGEERDGLLTSKIAARALLGQSSIIHCPASSKIAPIVGAEYTSSRHANHSFARRNIDALVRLNRRLFAGPILALMYKKYARRNNIIPVNRERSGRRVPILSVVSDLDPGDKQGAHNWMYLDLPSAQIAMRILAYSPCATIPHSFQARSDILIYRHPLHLRLDDDADRMLPDLRLLAGFIRDIAPAFIHIHEPEIAFSVQIAAGMAGGYPVLLSMAGRLQSQTVLKDSRHSKLQERAVAQTRLAACGFVQGPNSAAVAHDDNDADPFQPYREAMER